MMTRKTNPQVSRVLGLLLQRFDRLERAVHSISPENSDDDELLDSRDIRVLTKMSDRTILRRRNDGSLPYFKHGGKIYYRKSVVLKALEQFGETSPKR